MKQNQNWKKIGLQSQLILLEIGGLINDVTFAGPGWRGLRRDLHREKYYEQSRIYQLLYRLEKQGLIARKGKRLKDGLVLTATGQRQVNRVLADRLESPKQQPWDRKWHLIIFDVPEDHRVGRDLLRRRLNQLGCEQIQKSVFLYPYDLRPLIEQIRAAYDLRSDVIYVIAETIDGADRFQHYFEDKGILPSLK